MKVRNRIISFLLVMVLLVSTVPTSVFAASDTMYGIGFVTGSKVRLRSEASTDSKIVDNANKGEVVVVVSKHLHSAPFLQESCKKASSTFQPLIPDLHLPKR